MENTRKLRIVYTSSMDKENDEKLTDKNHLQNIGHTNLAKFYIDNGFFEVKNNPTSLYHRKEDLITGWSFENGPEPASDLCVYMDGDDVVYWEPTLERVLRLDFLNTSYSEGGVYRCGYVDGGINHTSGEKSTSTINSSAYRMDQLFLAKNIK